PIAQGVEEQGTGQAVLERSGGVARLVLEVEVDSPLAGQRDLQQMGVRGPPRLGLHGVDGVDQPPAGSAVIAVDVLSGEARPWDVRVGHDCPSDARAWSSLR